MRASTCITMLFAAIIPFAAAYSPVNSFPQLERRQTTNSTCPNEQAELEACAASHQPRIDECTNSNQGPVDYCCLCSVYTEKLNCFEVCPDSPDKDDVQDQLYAYCAASQDPCQATCLDGLLRLMNQCTGDTDYPCMCNTWTETLNCYAGCPLAPANPDAEVTRDQLCSLASASSSVPAPTPTPSSGGGCPAPRPTPASSSVVAITTSY
ncbi:hypothetical protein IQ07DRAFT_586942 [Pyrenochaeta sp. DS3sAY3a]|nr:hypothetical protein IQ07DRAFT_586942 [Pyrenochaeta sp. DS3sAY3a]